MGFKPRVSNCKTTTPQSPTGTLPLWFKKLPQRKSTFLLYVHNSKHCPQLVYVAINLKIILEFIQFIFLVVLGQLNDFLYHNQAESMTVFLTVSPHSFFSEGIILTGNNFKPSSVSVGGEGKEWGGSARCLKSCVWKPSHQ